METRDNVVFLIRLHDLLQFWVCGNVGGNEDPDSEEELDVSFYDALGCCINASDRDVEDMLQNIRLMNPTQDEVDEAFEGNLWEGRYERYCVVAE